MSREDVAELYAMAERRCGDTRAASLRRRSAGDRYALRELQANPAPRARFGITNAARGDAAIIAIRDSEAVSSRMVEAADAPIPS